MLSLIFLEFSFERIAQFIAHLLHKSAVSGSSLISGVLWQGSTLISVENSKFPCFSVSFTFQPEIRY